MAAFCALSAISCGGGGPARDAGKDVPSSTADGRVDTPGGGGADKPPVCADAGARKIAGDSCGCASDCQSGFCVDGVCCNTACTETCMACNTQEQMGTCSAVPKGQKPRLASTCPTSDVATCGTDGTCDGQGACRKYPTGTECKAGVCDGAAVTGRQICDDAGKCGPGDDVVCVPSSCDATKKPPACVKTCASNSDCVPGHTCVAGSCGPKMKGAACDKNEDCASGFCTDGLCCAVECKGACTSCNQVGREGTCWPTDEGNADPHGVCKDSGPTKCGETGTCDGFGGCSKYGPQTVCVLPSCAGDRLNTAGTCDGQGTCKPPGVQDCPPFRCVAGACNKDCKTDADCIAGNACVAGSCGLKQDGGSCTKGTECKSGFCVDGVCCNEMCGGSCRSCAMAGSAHGKCTPLAAGAADSRNVCKDMGAASCGNDGRCDGAGGCRKYRVGTVCAGEKCASNVYTPPAACSATGQCVAPATRVCLPFACNGTKCFDACTTTANCSPGNVCNVNSCGLKVPGAGCSANAECASNVCAQGVCCATTCNAACKSCALPGTAGTCTNVPTGMPDPKNMCLDQGAASCGNNGRCAAGACQKYAAGTKCKDSTCPAGVTFTGQSTCDGAGKCNTPATTSCFPFACGAAICRSTCTANADCAPNATCINGSCGLKPKGAQCNASAECGAGLVCSTREKVCCNTACEGACVSCTLAATLGTCSPVAAGATDLSGCGVSAASTCGNDGTCDGAGACHKWKAGTQCVPPMCPALTSTETLAKTCNGAGACTQGGTTRGCSPFMCDGMANACRETCTSNGDCVAPNTCINGSCGKKPAGAPCQTSDQCTTGLTCTDGFCCNTGGSGSCGACRACNATGMCADANGDVCTASDMCHQSQGTCMAGACQRPSISCDDGNGCTADSCSLTAGCVHTPLTGTTCDDNNACTQTSTCNAQGLCAGSNPKSCPAMGSCKGPGVCDTATGSCSNANLPDGTTCSDGSMCTTGDTCQGGACMGGTSVTCPAPDQCHTTRVCDPGTGVCSNPPKTGGNCDDGNKCTTGDTCTAGTCGGTAVVCHALDQCHAVGTCDPGTGDCDDPPKNSGACNDGNACTSGETCANGTCQGGTQTVCPGDDCHFGVCNQGSGNCMNGTERPDGTVCDDGDMCTMGETCKNGMCKDGTAVDCGLLICLPAAGCILPQ